MSASGLKYGENIFAFFYPDKVCLRTGPQFDLLIFDVLYPESLSPFKTKLSLKGWFYANSSECEL